MIKKNVKYKDFDGNEQLETLYFNITRSELLELDNLIPRLEGWKEKAEGPDRDLTTEETRDFLDIMKILIDSSYGIRSSDGKRFVKSPELLTEFKQSAVYDDFLFGLFVKPEEAVNFMVALVPEIPVADIEGTTTDVELPQPSTDEEPAWIRENREPTRVEMAGMNREQLLAAFQRKNQS